MQPKDREQEITALKGLLKEAQVKVKERHQEALKRHFAKIDAMVNEATSAR
ncbi:MAG: hypothetical protein JXK05_00830 [Campylobacterales bacterium]|nr:hypothetical protein [Campylobacterales bacterium]